MELVLVDDYLLCLFLYFLRLRQISFNYHWLRLLLVLPRERKSLEGTLNDLVWFLFNRTEILLPHVFVAE